LEELRLSNTQVLKPSEWRTPPIIDAPLIPVAPPVTRSKSASRAVANPAIERVRLEFEKRERQRLRDRRFNKNRHREEIQGNEMERRLFEQVSEYVV
jgi:hypothetical protein